VSTSEMMKRSDETSPRFKARLAGVLYLLAVLTAAFAETFVHGKLLFAVGLVPVACFVVVTILLYRIFKPVNRSLSLLAAFFNFVGLSLEALELHLWGVNIALLFHGLYCVLIGYLALQSTFVPRILGVLMAIGGLAWLTDLSTPLTDHLSPYNVATGFLGEGSLMLWLLVVGVNVSKWEEKASVGRANKV